MSITVKCDDGDLVLDDRHAFMPIDGEEKCAQDVGESLLNNWDPDGINWFNGSELYSLIGETPSSLDRVSPDEQIHFIVEEAIMRLQDLQDNDAYVDSEEAIDEIRTIDVFAIGKMTYVFRLELVTLSDELLVRQYEISLSQQLPSTQSLAEFRSFVPKSPSDNPFL